MSRISRRTALMLGAGTAIGATVGSRPASAATNWLPLVVGTANIGRAKKGATDLLRPERNQAINDMRWKAKSGELPFIGWQEIREGATDADRFEEKKIKQHFHPWSDPDFPGQYTNEFIDHPDVYRVPLSIPTPHNDKAPLRQQWRVVSTATHKAHGPVESYSPRRDINEVVIANVVHPELTFVLMNTHYIAGAYTSKDIDSLKPYWDKMKELHANRVKAHHDNNRLVIWTADVNRGNYTTASTGLGEKQVFTDTFDRINRVPDKSNKVSLRLVSHHDVPFTIEKAHNGRVAVFEIKLN